MESEGSPELATAASIQDLCLDQEVDHHDNDAKSGVLVVGPEEQIRGTRQYIRIDEVLKLSVIDHDFNHVGGSRDHHPVHNDKEEEEGVSQRELVQDVRQVADSSRGSAKDILAGDVGQDQLDLKKHHPLDKLLLSLRLFIEFLAVLHLGEILEGFAFLQILKVSRVEHLSVEETTKTHSDDLH